MRNNTSKTIINVSNIDRDTQLKFKLTVKDDRNGTSDNIININIKKNINDINHLPITKNLTI